MSSFRAARRCLEPSLSAVLQTIAVLDSDFALARFFEIAPLDSDFALVGFFVAFACAGCFSTTAPFSFLIWD